MSILGVLKEELDNSLKLKKQYEEELASLEKGSIVKKKINNHWYYYKVYRDNNGKVKFDYLGKEISPEQFKKFDKIKQKRDIYKESLKKVKSEIQLLHRVLNGQRAKQAVT